MKHASRRTKAVNDSYSIVAVLVAAIALACVAFAGDHLFADDFHVAMYGSTPAVPEYTPVQKSSVSAKTTTAAQRAAARLKAKPLASSSSSSSAYINPYPPIDATTCVKGNPASCTALINAFQQLGNPLCMFVEGCATILTHSYATPECLRNAACSRSMKMFDWYFVRTSECALRQPTLSCKKKTDDWIRRGMPSF